MPNKKKDRKKLKIKWSIRKNQKRKEHTKHWIKNYNFCTEENLSVGEDKSKWVDERKVDVIFGGTRKLIKEIEKTNS